MTRRRKFIFYQYKAVAVDVTDGDTLIVDLDLGHYLRLEIKARLARIDCPERGKKGWAYSREFIKEICPPGTPLIVSTDKVRKYARRCICEIWAPNGNNLSDYLLANNEYCKLYE